MEAGRSVRRLLDSGQIRADGALGQGSNGSEVEVFKLFFDGKWITL